MNYAMVHLIAKTTGRSAGMAAKPNPMHIDGFTVNEGVCGMAYVKIVAKNKEAKGFVKWLKENNIGFKAYGSGWQIPCDEFNQSFARKLAYCEAYAAHLRMLCNIPATVVEWVN
jgi:hypothetical protein